MSRRRAAAVLVLLAAVGVVAGVVVSSGSPSKPRSADSSTGFGATAMQRRNLIETDTESGTLSYAGSRTIYNRLSGTITWLPAVGQLIEPGYVLFRVDNQPVLLMNDTTPAYRDLDADDTDGPDILELNADLVALGYNPSGGGGIPVAILQTTSDHLVVTVALAATSQSEAKVGEVVTVEMPAGNTVNGRITAVSSVAQSSSSAANSAANNGSSSSSPTIPVTIRLTHHVSGAGLDQAAVSVNFAEAKANNVLSVSVTALLATSGGTYAVQGAAAPHELIPVTTGLFAAGYVQISGAGIYPGLEVTDSQG